MQDASRMMQGTGLHLASRCEKMQVPEQFQATDALKKAEYGSILLTRGRGLKENRYARNGMHDWR